MRAWARRGHEIHGVWSVYKVIYQRYFASIEFGICIGGSDWLDSMGGEKMVLALYRR